MTVSLPQDRDPAPDHGGGVDAAVARFGGKRSDWIDLSTGINPVPYPIAGLTAGDWADLPDQRAMQRLEQAARAFWGVPDGAAVLAAPGASALIARIPALRPPGRIHITAPTYNEHARAFAAAGWEPADSGYHAQVIVHPNNPDGKVWDAGEVTAKLSIIDESFCDVMPDKSLIALSTRPGTLILKSFGKFWGLAGLRLGFAIGDPALVARIDQMLGPWPVSGPALRIGAAALSDADWAMTTRARLASESHRLDRLMAAHSRLQGGTDLFRLYHVSNAAHMQARLARHHIWSRIFPYSQTWIRLGLPGTEAQWDRLDHALKDMA